MTLLGKTFVVTGAGSGIGRAVALALLEAGADVALVGRREAPLSEVAAYAQTSTAVPMVADVADRAAAAQVVEATLERFGRIDGLVNNAGVARFAPIEEADPADLGDMVDAHLLGPFLMIRSCLPALRATNGSIVNVTSVGGVLALPGRALYGATKAATNSLTRSLARELAPHVRVNAVLPGPVDTPMYDDLGLDATATAALRLAMVTDTPMGRFGRPEEVASWVCRLLDPDVAGWMTGALVPVDGGRTA